MKTRRTSPLPPRTAIRVPSQAPPTLQTAINMPSAQIT